MDVLCRALDSISAAKASLKRKKQRYDKKKKDLEMLSKWMWIMN